MQAQIIPGTEGYPPWVQLVAVVAFGIVMGVGAAVTQIKGKREAERKLEEGKKQAANTVGHMMAVQPSADRMTMEMLVESIAALKFSVDRLHARLDKEEMRDQVEKEMEMIELLRIAKQLKDKGEG